MADPIALGVLFLVLITLLASYFVLKLLKPLIINAIVGLIVLFLAGALGAGVEITPLVVLIVALGGVPAAILVLILAYAGIVFAPAVVAGVPAVVTSVPAVAASTPAVVASASTVLA